MLGEGRQSELGAVHIDFEIEATLASYLAEDALGGHHAIRVCLRFFLGLFEGQESRFAVLYGWPLNEIIYGYSRWFGRLLVLFNQLGRIALISFMKILYTLRFGLIVELHILQSLLSAVYQVVLAFQQQIDCQVASLV